MRLNGWRRLTGVLAVAALVAAGCGGDDDGGQPGFDGTTITLGVLTPQTGRAGVIGVPLTAGQQVYWEAVNTEDGGVAGQYPVELTVQDTQYNPTTAAQQFNGMVDDVVAFQQILGTPVVNAVLEQINAENVLTQPASLDSFWAAEENLLHLGAPYQIQALNAMDWLINQEGRADETICWAGHDDPYGNAGLEGMEAAGEVHGFELAAEVAFASDLEDATAHGPNVGALRSAGCTVVFLTALPSTTGAILGAAANPDDPYAPLWIGQSPTWVSALAESPLAPYLSRFFKLMSEGPEWGDTSSEGMAQMLEDIETYMPDQAPDIYFAFGYAAAWSMHQVLEVAAANDDLSRDGIDAALESVGTITTGGLLGDYAHGGPADREPPRDSRVFNVDPEAPDTGYLVAETDEFASDSAVEFDFELG